MNLTEEQRNFIRDNSAAMPDLIQLTQALFKDETIDGRSKEGRAVRKFCVEESIDFKTTKHLKAKEIELSEEQKEFSIEYSRDGMNPYQIASLLFAEDSITPLSKETLVVTAFLNENGPEGQIAEPTGFKYQYIGPKTATVIVNKVNEAAGSEWLPNKLTIAQRDCVDALKRYLGSPRLCPNNKQLS